MNIVGYRLTKAFYAEVEGNEDMQTRCTAHHHSLYTWICELRNRVRVQHPNREILDLPVRDTLQMSFIGSDKTLKKCIDDLEKWNIIEILQRGNNQHVPTKIQLAVAFLRKHCDSDAIAVRLQADSSTIAVRPTKTAKTGESGKVEKKEKKDSPLSPQGVEIVAMLASFKYQSDAFRLAWQEWEQYRKESQKPLRPTTVFKQLKQLETITEAQAIAMIEQSMKNGWQGLFDLKSNARTESITSLPQHTSSVNKPYRELV